MKKLLIYLPVMFFCTVGAQELTKEQWDKITICVGNGPLSKAKRTYETVQHCYNKETTKWENCIIVHKAKYSDFLRHEDEDGVLEGRWGMPFLDYCEENLGVTWWDADGDDDEDEDE